MTRADSPTTGAAPAGGTRHVWVLLAFDPSTGLATRPVGAAGTEQDATHVSWVPLEPAADAWRQRLHPDAGTAPVRDRLAWWAEHANGVTVALAEVDPPPATTLPAAVEAVVDTLMCHEAGW